MRIEINNSFCKVLDAEKYQTELLSRRLSYQNKKLQYLKTQNPKLYRFDTRKKLFNKKTKKFPTGLLSNVLELFDEDELNLEDLRREPSKVLYLNKNFYLDPLRYYQEEALEIAKKIHRGTFEMATGCHKIDTPILMYDGSIKKVQDVQAGDQLMGPDSKPRRVLSLCRVWDKF